MAFNCLLDEIQATPDRMNAILDGMNVIAGRMNRAPRQDDALEWREHSVTEPTRATRIQFTGSSDSSGTTVRTSR